MRVSSEYLYKKAQAIRVKDEPMKGSPAWNLSKVMAQDLVNNLPPISSALLLFCFTFEIYLDLDLGQSLDRV